MGRPKELDPEKLEALANSITTLKEGTSWAGLAATVRARTGLQISAEALRKAAAGLGGSRVDFIWDRFLEAPTPAEIAHGFRRPRSRDQAFSEIGKAVIPPHVIFQEAAGRLGLDQLAIARTLGVTPGAVSRWFSGQRTPRHTGQLERLCSLLQVDIAVVLEMEERSSAAKKAGRQPSWKHRELLAILPKPGRPMATDPADADELKLQRLLARHAVVRAVVAHAEASGCSRAVIRHAVSGFPEDGPIDRHALERAIIDEERAAAAFRSAREAALKDSS